jgi:alcohol dehydrogenase
MSGVVLTRHGGPEALAWRDDLPVPRPGAGQVLVEVLAAGVNNTDIATREGWYAREATGGGAGDGGGWAGAIAFPRIQGGDLCGRVVSAGPGVDRVGPGARVTAPINLPRPTSGNPVGFISLGSEIDGAFAEYCLMEAEDLHDVTSSPLSDIEVAAMPCAFGTAANLLDRAGVAGGQRVLVTGASGGVGLAAVQLARLRGADVTGVAAQEKAEAVRRAGAAEVIGRDAVPAPAAFDAVIDLVGGAGWSGLIRALKPGGHYAVAGAIAGPLVEADLRDIYLRDITIHGCTFQPPETFRRLVALMNAGKVRPLVSGVYPLAEIARAQADFVSKRLPGKLVLIPQKEAA